MTLKNVTLDDKYDLTQGRVFVTGYQALIRATLMQQERDRLAGLNTAGYVSGYRGSPLGGLDQQFMRAQSALDTPQRPVPDRPQRGPRRDRDLGHAAGRAARRGQVRRRVRHVVRQGAGRRPHRRRLPPRQFRRLLEERRRGRPDGRRPHGGILHHRAPVRIPLRRRDDPDPEPRGRAGDHRLRALRLGDVALLRLVGGAQMHARDGGVDRRGRRRARPREDRHSGRRRVQDAAGRAQHPPGRRHSRHGSAPARLQARRHAGLRQGEQAQPRDHLGRAQSEDRHHHGRQKLSRRAPGVRRARHRRGEVQRPRHQALQDRVPVADLAPRAEGIRRRASNSSSWSRKSAR